MKNTQYPWYNDIFYDHWSSRRTGMSRTDFLPGCNFSANTNRGVPICGGGEVTVLSGHHNECPLPKAQALGFLLYVWSVHVQCRPCQLCCESFLLSRRVPVRRQVGWCVESIRQRRSFDCSVHVYQRVHSASTWVVWMNVHSGYSSECSMVVPT